MNHNDEPEALLDQALSMGLSLTEACPDALQWEAFVTGSCDEITSARLRVHIQNCVICFAQYPEAERQMPPTPLVVPGMDLWTRSLAVALLGPSAVDTLTLKSTLRALKERGVEVSNPNRSPVWWVAVNTSCDSEHVPPVDSARLFGFVTDLLDCLDPDEKLGAVVCAGRGFLGKDGPFGSPFDDVRDLESSIKAGTVRLSPSAVKSLPPERIILTDPRLDLVSKPDIHWNPTTERARPGSFNPTRSGYIRPSAPDISITQRLSRRLCLTSLGEGNLFQVRRQVQAVVENTRMAPHAGIRASVEARNLLRGVIAGPVSRIEGKTSFQVRPIRHPIYGERHDEFRARGGAETHVTEVTCVPVRRGDLATLECVPPEAYWAYLVMDQDGRLAALNEGVPIQTPTSSEPGQVDFQFPAEGSLFQAHAVISSLPLPEITRLILAANAAAHAEGTTAVGELSQLLLQDPCQESFAILHSLDFQVKEPDLQEEEEIVN